MNSYGKLHIFHPSSHDKAHIPMIKINHKSAPGPQAKQPFCEVLLDLKAIKNLHWAFRQPWLDVLLNREEGTSQPGDNQYNKS